MKTPKAPAAPDPVATAQAQTGSNVATAQANAAMNMVNQVTPDGSLTYSQSGKQFVADPTGGTMYYRGPNGEISTTRPTTTGAATTRQVPIYEKTWNDNGKALVNKLTGYRTETVPGAATAAEGWTELGKGYFLPQYTATQTLSPQQQAIKDQEDAASLNMGTIANQQSGFLKDYLSKPITLDNEATEARLMELGRKRLDPMLADRQASLETSLANRGIQIGSKAWDTAMGQNSEAANDAYNSLLLTGRQQAVQERLSERNQPINEITALLSGAQVSQPNFVNTPSSNVANTDYAGLVQQNYSNALQQWQTKVNSQNSALGAIAGVAGAGLGGWAQSGFKMSDRRVKQDVRLIGDTGRGFNLYSFTYLGSDAREVGFMADEVEAILPEAVAEFGGIKHVNYAMLEAA